MRRLLPAIKNHETGEVHKGKRGWTHQDISVHKGFDPKKPFKGSLGYWDPNKKEFHPKHGPDGLNIDSTKLKDTTDNMSDFRRTKEMLKYVNEDNIVEIFGLLKKLKSKMTTHDHEYLDMPRVDGLKQHKIRKSFHQMTNKNVPDDTVPHIRKYLASSKDFDDHYKGENKDPEVAKGAKKIEDVIKKTKTPRNMHMYRGFDDDKEIKPGTEIHHHGITSYGSSPSFANMYRSKHVVKVKVPKGTRAAYIEHIAQERHHKFSPKKMESMYNHGGEENWVLHPKSHIRITASKVKNGRHYHDAELVHDGVEDK